MTLDPITFGFEIVNILVLLWLLQRFLYKPIRNAIAERQSTVVKTLQDAEAKERAAATLVAELKQNQDDWAAEKARLQSQLQETFAQEREQALSKVHEAVNVEKARLQTLLDQDQTLMQQETHRQAVDSALQLTGRLLQRLSGSELDLLLIKMFQEDLRRLSDEEQNSLKKALQQQKGRISITSAHPLNETLVQSIQQALSELYEQVVINNTNVEPKLISGIKISIGTEILHANLGEELDFFRADLHHDRH